MDLFPPRSALFCSISQSLRKWMVLHSPANTRGELGYVDK